tara:strand:- start:3048 stop:3425 length:378 start_codon:yes stop_codon:yes gene_type:complete
LKVAATAVLTLALPWSLGVRAETTLRAFGAIFTRKAGVAEAVGFERISPLRGRSVSWAVLAGCGARGSVLGVGARVAGSLSSAVLGGAGGAICTLICAEFIGKFSDRTFVAGPDVCSEKTLLTLT